MIGRLLSPYGQIGIEEFWRKGILVPILLGPGGAIITLAITCLVPPLADNLTGYALPLSTRNIFSLVLIVCAVWILFASSAKRYRGRGVAGKRALIALMAPFGPVWMIFECGFPPDQEHEPRYLDVLGKGIAGITLLAMPVAALLILAVDLSHVYELWGELGRIPWHLPLRTPGPSPFYVTPEAYVGADKFWLYASGIAYIALGTMLGVYVLVLERVLRVRFDGSRWPSVAVTGLAGSAFTITGLSAIVFASMIDADHGRFVSHVREQGDREIGFYIHYSTSSGVDIYHDAWRIAGALGFTLFGLGTAYISFLALRTRRITWLVPLAGAALGIAIFLSWPFALFAATISHRGFGSVDALWDMESGWGIATIVAYRFAILCLFLWLAIASSIALRFTFRTRTESRG